MRTIMSFFILIFSISCHPELNQVDFDEKIQGSWKPVKVLTSYSSKVDTNALLTFNKGRFSVKQKSFRLDSTYLIDNDTLIQFGKLIGAINPKHLIQFKGDTLVLKSLDDPDHISDSYLLPVNIHDL